MWSSRTGPSPRWGGQLGLTLGDLSSGHGDARVGGFGAIGPLVITERCVHVRAKQPTNEEVANGEFREEPAGTERRYRAMLDERGDRILRHAENHGGLSDGGEALRGLAA